MLCDCAPSGCGCAHCTIDNIHVGFHRVACSRRAKEIRNAFCRSILFCFVAFDRFDFAHFSHKGAHIATASTIQCTCAHATIWIFQLFLRDRDLYKCRPQPWSRGIWQKAEKRTRLRPCADAHTGPRCQRQTIDNRHVTDDLMRITVYSMIYT